MATVTAPIMTDATGQSIDSKLNSLLGKMDNLAAAFQPNASGIVYSNITSGLTGDDVQEAIDEMAADVSEIKQSLSNLIQYVLIQGTTSSSGALALPSEVVSGAILDMYYEGSGVNGFINRRDKNYLTCYDNNLNIKANTPVKIHCYYTPISQS